MEKDIKIAVAGTGYVGLSIATLLSQHHHVTAVDVIPEKVTLINNRKSPIQDEYIEKYLAEKDLSLCATLDGASAYRPKCDGAIYIVGDSMYPLLKSGDIVLYKQLKDIGDIFWGDMYLLSIDIDGEEYITVKYIQKSEREGYVKLVSQNPHHADKEVAVDRIRALALVKASIRMNSIR